MQVTPQLSGTVLPSGPNGLRNLQVYSDGGAIGSSISTATSGVASTFNLGSSLIIPAGKSVIISIRADLMDASNVNYTGGLITANINLPVNSYRG